MLAELVHLAIRVQVKILLIIIDALIGIGLLFNNNS